MTSVRDLAAQTPPDRNRAVDCFRAAALMLVVLGHWLAAAVWLDDGGSLRFNNILVIEEWTYWLTWVFQVMPVFFVVGGYANWRSYRSALARGDSLSSWITRRYRRLMTPIAAFLTVWVLVVIAAGLLGVSASLIRSGSLAVVVPLWFLAVYLLVIPAVPVTSWLWDRMGTWSIAAGLAAAIAVDALRLVESLDWVGWVNFVFVWLTVHQIGYAWVTERRAPSRRLLATGAVVLPIAIGAVTVFGPYPVAMVGVVGFTDNNALPPTAVLLVFGVWQYCLVRLFEPAASRLMHRPGPWTAVVGFHTVMMTVYVWHLPVLALVVLAGYGLGFGFDFPPLGAGWWVTRPLWIALLSVVLAGFVLVFGRYEVRVRTTDTPHPWLVAVGVVASITAISASVVVGLVPEEGLLNWWIVVLFAIGVLALGAYPARATSAMTPRG